MQSRRALALAFSIGFLGVGLPYWLIPYQKLNLPDALLSPGLVLVALAALLLGLRGLAPFWRSVGIVGAAVPAAVFARVVVDGLRDPTSHNLWPLEIMIAAPLGLICAAGGAVAGSLLARLRTGEPKRPSP